MIKNFYKVGTPFEDIAKASNLSVEKVREIIEKKQKNSYYSQPK